MVGTKAAMNLTGSKPVHSMHSWHATASEFKALTFKVADWPIGTEHS